MALYSRFAEVVSLDVLQESGANGIHRSGAMTGVFVAQPNNHAENPAGQTLRLEQLRQATRRIKRYYLPFAFFAGLLLGCVATRTSQKERDVYRELAPSTELAYKMKATLLKADLLLQGMDTVIENTSKNFRFEGK